MTEDKPKEIKEKDLPWFYRLILKIPGTEFLGNAGGVFWAILMPIFLVAEFFFSLFLLVAFPFPINIILVSVIPAITLALFVKISLKRFINWWNANFGESRFNWNMEKTLDEYIVILQRKRGKKSIEEKS
ncbi:MAG: hypothetical protein QXL77_05580 [Candidatus Bathyarchaeia archaeon]